MVGNENLQLISLLVKHVSMNKISIILQLFSEIITGSTDIHLKITAGNLQKRISNGLPIRQIADLVSFDVIEVFNECANHLIILF